MMSIFPILDVCGLIGWSDQTRSGMVEGVTGPTGTVRVGKRQSWDDDNVGHITGFKVGSHRPYGNLDTIKLLASGSTTAIALFNLLWSLYISSLPKRDTTEGSQQQSSAKAGRASVGWVHRSTRTRSSIVKRVVSSHHPTSGQEHLLLLRLESGGCL